MPDYNFPDKDDPDFSDKLSLALKDLFDKADSNVKNFSPISSPEEGLQIGSIWFDETDEKLKVNTSSGVKVLKYE